MVWRKGTLDEIVNGTIIKIDEFMGDYFIDIILKDGSKSQLIIDDHANIGLEVEVKS